MTKFEPGKIYFYRYLSDNPWYSYIWLKCIKRTAKTAAFQRTNGEILRGRLKPTWREDGERVKLDGWIYLESSGHDFRPGLEDCNIKSLADAEALFPGDNKQPEPEQPAPKIRAVETSAAPFVVIMPEEPSENIKLWYSSQYPRDEMGEELNPEITFADAYQALNHGAEWYDYTGADDSIVRERIFEALASVFNCDYEAIYNLWINA